MDNSIYSEMSNLRPTRRGRRSRRDPVNRPRGNKPAEDPGPQEMTTPAFQPVPDATPDPPRAPGDETESAALKTSRLAASLEHLRRRPLLGSAGPSTEHAPTPPENPIHESPVAAAEGPAEQDRAIQTPDSSGREEGGRKARTPRRAETGTGSREQPAPSRAATASDTSDLETGPAPPLPDVEAAPVPSRKAARRQRKAQIAEAKQAVATQTHTGKTLVKDAKSRARNSEYLPAKIPHGEWTRRELRGLQKSAKKTARTERAEIQARERARLVAAKHELRLIRQSSSGPARRGRDHLADARVRSIRLGLFASWLGLGAMSWVGWNAGNFDVAGYRMPMAAGAAGILLLSLTPWRRLGWRLMSSMLVFLWLAVLVGVMVATAPYHESTLSLFIASVWIVVYAAVLLPLPGYTFTAALAVAAFGFSVSLGPVAVPQVELGLYVAGLAMTALIGGITVHELRAQAVQTARRLTELEAQSDALLRREREILQLYEVSRTIGAGDDMEEVLPELVARTAGYIGAKVGLVILHKPDDQQLVALSPLWVAGQALEAEGYRFDVEGDSTAAIVFESGAAHVRNVLTEIDISRDQLLADLGVERVAAVPLRVEGNTIGVLLVADKATDFTDADTAALELLSTPAGLVLNHLARYQEAQETGRRMSEVAQLKSDFVSVVSHELRTPLTSVIGALSTLARPELAPENPVALRLLDSASGQAKRLKTLIEDLLTVSKIDNDALPIRLSIGDLSEVLTRLINTVSAWTEHVTLGLSPNLPNVAFDPDHFERVITNLLDNAHKYASGSAIEVTARAVGDEVWVSIIDHGEGIPYEYEQTIFERFTQIERADTRFKGGTGLGLNIVRDLTEAMKGRVWLEATPESGATFIVAFPRAEDGATPSVEVGSGMLLVDPSRDRVEAPVYVDDLATGGEGPVTE